MMNAVLLQGTMLGDDLSAYLSTHGGYILIRRVSESGEQEWLAAAWYAKLNQYDGVVLYGGDPGQSLESEGTA